MTGYHARRLFVRGAVIASFHGIDPAPQRGTKMSWKTFLAAHWEGLAAADFFTVEVLTIRGLVRYGVFFVMKLKTPHGGDRLDHV
jgi:hypothetical protein